MSLACRPAVAADEDAVRRLATAFDPRTEDGFEERYARILGRDDWALLVACDGPALVGYALAQDYGPGLRRAFGVGRMHDLYVDPAYRRRGAGRLLVQSVVAWCRTRPAPMILDWQSRLDAAPFYDALGLTGDTTGDTATYPAYSIDLRQDAQVPSPLKEEP